MALSDDIEEAFKAVDESNKPASSPKKKRSSSLERSSSNLSFKSPTNSPKGGEGRRGRSLERAPVTKSPRSEKRNAKRSSSLSSAPTTRFTLAKKGSSDNFSESSLTTPRSGGGGGAPSFRRSDNVITFDLWLAASQAIKGLPPPIDGMSAEKNLDMRKRLSVKADLRAKKNWLIALRTIVTCRHWAGVAGYDWNYDRTPVEKLPGFIPLTPTGSSRSLTSSFGSNSSMRADSEKAAIAALSPRSKARIGTQF